MSDRQGNEGMPKKTPKHPFKVPKVHGAALLQLTWQTFNDASRRSRWILIILVTASTVLFVGYWNALPQSWTRSRADVLYDVLLYRAYDPSESFDSSRHLAIDKKRFEQLKAYCDERHLSLRGVRGIGETNAPWGEEVLLRQRLERMLQARDDVFSKHVLLLSIPFFGVAVDVNDLGVFGGITLTILLVMYLFSLSRERDSLQHALQRKSQRVPLARFYPLISSAQVLEVPQPLWGRRVHPLRRAMNEALSLLPSIIQLLIVTHDYRTWGMGSSIAHESTKYSLALSCAFLMAIIVLTALVLDVHGEISRLWRKALEDARKHIKVFKKHKNMKKHKPHGSRG